MPRILENLSTIKPLISLSLLWVTPVNAQLEEAGSKLSGKSVYEQSCISCHGDDGTGGMPGVPDMTEKGGSLEKPNAVLVKNIIEGIQSPGSPLAMPPKGGNPKLNDANIDAVIAYIRHTFGNRENGK